MGSVWIIALLLTLGVVAIYIVVVAAVNIVVAIILLGFEN